MRPFSYSGPQTASISIFSGKRPKTTNWTVWVTMTGVWQKQCCCEDEFFNAFEFADVLHDREFDPDTDVNPFLHITIHTAVENQLAAKDPIEVLQFYNAMRKKKCSHHDTIHLIGAILVPLMFDTMKHQKPFDNDRYVSMLKKYKSRKPDKIWALLDSSGDV